MEAFDTLWPLVLSVSPESPRLVNMQVHHQADIFVFPIPPYSGEKVINEFTHQLRYV
jgi:hypothetical protein